MTFITAITCTQAHAVQRTHVSAAFGNDANTATNCTAAAPCRFFQSAMTVTDNNGEVIVLDSGGYGAVTITQSVALIAPPGVYGGITVFASATGVNIAAPLINVVLRGLTINGQRGTYGIFMNSGGGRLSVENCVIANMTDTGIYAFGSGDIRIVDSTFRSNGVQGIFLFNGMRGTIARTIVSASGSTGILVSGITAGTNTLVDIADTTVDATTFGNGDGIVVASSNATAAVKVSVRDSRVTRNSRYAMSAQSTAGGPATLNASNNIVSNNGYGLAALSSGARVIAGGNTVTGNPISGLFNSAGVFESAGNNIVRDNGANSGAITVFAAQ